MCATLLLYNLITDLLTTELKCGVSNNNCYTFVYGYRRVMACIALYSPSVSSKVGRRIIALVCV